MARILKLLIFIFISAPAFAHTPGKSAKKPKKSTISVVQNIAGKNVITLESPDQLRNISFVIADSQGIIRMFGDNYRTGASINVSHLTRGYYTIIFSKDVSSSVGHFTVK